MGSVSNGATLEVSSDLQGSFELKAWSQTWEQKASSNYVRNIDAKTVLYRGNTVVGNMTTTTSYDTYTECWQTYDYSGSEILFRNVTRGTATYTNGTTSSDSDSDSAYAGYYET